MDDDIVRRCARLRSERPGEFTVSPEQYGRGVYT
jgi:hypothetical protein